ncbi:MAG: ribosome recycling factor [Rhodospirillaceae bacterium]|jgi:ribosome recycling factor|nr:ribosome recycling factor [Rhodospirillaceae bacterium]MBT3885376.1 ribosome recycling factor [Rhodospirillaceae bacterium]MBT4118779.1 ribosome recycling factor [Rhodospirillaceae bacterium]MBT4671491.1 ribosome recycling factor [Rhodospirillaceae bacterium]MBT4719882.1 ribosome recycling factor [Rhodospirillaceae bacterium]
MEFETTKRDIRRRMEGALEVLHKEFGGLRTGRAAASLLEPLTVEAYGQPMPINQVGTIGVPEPRMLTVQVWDKGLVSSVEKSIRESDLGLNPSNDGQLVRVPIPPLSEERRIEITKIAGRYAEEAKVAVRNVRRHSLDELKKAEKSGDISEDELRDYSQEIQDVTDEFVTGMDDTLAKKEQEILQV